MAASIFQTVMRLRNFREVAGATRAGILSRIGPIGNPRISLIPVIEQWFREGNTIYRFEFRDVIRSLRSQKRYKHALEFCGWMARNRILVFTPTDCALELDLIGTFHGLDSAESYFNSVSDEYKTRETYGALLSCYVKHREFGKSLWCFQATKDLGLTSVTSYTGIMSLYVRTDQVAKVPSVIAMMKKEGVGLDGFSYRVWMNSCSSRFDRDSVEKILEEVENQGHPELDWKIYDSVANFYIKAGDCERSLFYLEKSEQLLGTDRAGYTVLISQYGRLGQKGEMMRLWGVQRAKFTKQSNRDYVAMLGLLVKLGEIEEAEKLVTEWESSCQHYDFRVPEILLLAYCQKGLPEKAESRLHEMIGKGSGKGKSPVPSNWATVAAGYLDRQNMVKALECINKALALGSEDSSQRLSLRVPMAILDWLAYNGDIDEVEAYVSSMKKAFPVSREMYHGLIRAYVRMGREVGGVLERMRSDDIDVDEETERLVSLYTSDSDM